MREARVRPYKIMNLWVDLDHIQGATEKAELSGDSFPPMPVYVGSLIMAFQDKPLRVWLGYDLIKAQAAWAALVEAWKNAPPKS